MRVIDNEFDDKNYVREHPVGIYSIDFAWPHKMKAIEIDGNQHQRFKEYRERDARKDIRFKEAGWEVLRIVWKDLFHDPSRYIAMAKNFLKS